MPLLYVERYCHSHGMQLPDALIAATAVTLGVPLLTANIKHYAALKDFEVRPFKPH